MVGHETLGYNITPINYKLKFEPNLKTFKYKCSERILVKIKKRTKKIRINGIELDIKNVVVSNKGKEFIAKVKSYKSKEEILLVLDTYVKGEAEIIADFEGTNNDKLAGFYRSKYTNNGKEEYILTSQFEAADARRAFLCFDEPEFKATFDITFVIDRQLKAISNTTVISEESIENEKKLVRFRRTPEMPTYLLYLGVGKFEISASRMGKVLVRAVTVPGKIKYTKMSLGFAKKFIRFYEEYFKIRYPLQKLDLLAIPDFAAGAMENWGAITFREVEILGDEKISSVAIKQRIAEVVAHELTHQWFGDLVTMKWWNDLWLNESFATFLSYKAIDNVFPKWEMGTQYYLDTIGTAYSADQLKSTHPISVHVNKPSEIDSIFDEISYEKGGTILNMLEDYVTPETFREGMHVYLKNYAYSNATKYDLWDSIAKAARAKNQKIKLLSVARYWIDNPGYPIIEVEHQKKKKVITLNQRRYLLVDDKKYNQVWPIPVHYLMPKNKEGFMLFDKKTTTMPYSEPYIKLDHRQKGLYRVRYPQEMLERLGSLIKAKKLNPIDSWGVENDLYALARSSKLPYNRYLSFVEKYCFDGDFPMNVSISGHLNRLYEMLYKKHGFDRVKGVVLRYHRHLFKKLGWTRKSNERNVMTMLRSGAISTLGTSGDKRILKKAVKIFDSYIKENKEIDPNLRGAVYRLRAWSGNKYIFKRLVGLYKEAKLPEESRRLLGSMGGFKDKGLISKALQFSLSKSVRFQDTFVIPAVTSSNDIGKEFVWPWTKKNWRELKKRYPSGTHMLARFVENMEYVDDQKTKADIVEFFSKKQNMRNDIKKSLTQTIEVIDSNIKFLSFNKA